MPSFIGFIPTEPEFIPGFFELCPVSLQDVVYDLGCGDGRLLFEALERGALRAVGIDIDPGPIYIARQIARTRGLENRITFINDDVLNVNVAGATVVFYYISRKASEALKPKLERELRPGTRVVTQLFPFPGWKPAKIYEMTDEIDHVYRIFYLYVMPPEPGGSVPMVRQP